MIDVVCAGFAVYDVNFPVNAFPNENIKYIIPRTVESSGGPACNAASLLGIWGAGCALAATIGDDLYGQSIQAELKASGVSTEFLDTRKDWPTALSFIIANSGKGTRTILTRQKPGAALSIDLEKLAGESPRVLLFDGHESEASERLLEAFPGAISILDAGTRRAGTELLAPLVDYCVASEPFALQMTSETEAIDLENPARVKSIVSALSSFTKKFVAITLGERGCVFFDPRNGAYGKISALPATAIDTTAAGDIFHGAFAFALLKGKEAPEALRLATAAAGLSVGREGGRTSIPSLIETEKALSDFSIKIEFI